MCEELVSQCLCTSSFMGCIDPFFKKWGNSSSLLYHGTLWQDRKKTIFLVSSHIKSINSLQPLYFKPVFYKVWQCQWKQAFGVFLFLI